MSVLLPATVFCLLSGSCFSGSKEKKLEVQEITVCDQAVGSHFSLHAQDGQLHIIYPSLDALSLNLVSADTLAEPLRPNLGETKYLDRISYSPDIGDDFGRHLFLVSGSFYHILYVDQESQDNSVLKWLSKTGADESWWIDAFPELSDPLAAVTEEDGSLQVVFSEGRTLSLYRLHAKRGGSAADQPTPLATTSLSSGALRPVGETCVVRQGEEWAFSVYDDGSKRLYLVHPGQDTLSIEPVYASGEVHYSTVLDDHLYILVFDPTESTITLLERASLWHEAADRHSFEVTPVTLCQGTTSVYMTTYNGEHLFLFTERVIEPREEAGYKLSLLFPESASGNYQKTTLLEEQTYIQGFRALKTADTLYVLTMNAGRLVLLSVSLDALIRSP